jgi:hypothetical protein
MKVKFEIYSSLLKEVKEVSDKISNIIREYTNGKEKLLIGWKMGEITVTFPKGKTSKEMKRFLEEAFNKKVTDQNIWLKEVDVYEK